MPFINVNLDDIQEAKPVPGGKYEVQITACEETLTKEKQKPQYKMTLMILGHDDAPPVNHYQGIPAEDDEPNTAQFKALLLKRLLALFKIHVGKEGFDTSALAMELIGASATVELRLGKPNDSGVVYNELVLPRLKEESAAHTGAAKPPQKRAA